MNWIQLLMRNSWPQETRVKIVRNCFYVVIATTTIFNVYHSESHHVFLDKMILARVIQHQTLKHWTSVWTQQGMMGSGQMRSETNFQGSEFECFGFAGDCGIIVKLRSKLQTQRLRIKELTRLAVTEDNPWITIDYSFAFRHFCNVKHNKIIYRWIIGVFH